MIFRRIVCLSDPHPTASGEEVLNVCRSYPTPHTLSGISGKLIALGEQFVLMLEGGPSAVEGLVRRLQAQAPEVGMKPHFRDTSETRAFRSLAIQDVYADELARENEGAAEELQDLLIDLLGGVETEERDPFGDLAKLLTTPASLPAAKRQVVA